LLGVFCAIAGNAARLSPSTAAERALVIMLLSPMIEEPLFLCRGELENGDQVRNQFAGTSWNHQLL
jgi:hypothetical protein